MRPVRRVYKKDFEKEGVDTACLIEDARKIPCVFAFIDEQGGALPVGMAQGGPGI